ncbi:unnamed protein product [Mytilus coruscus]|uniref:Reverse transcriptase domain-containing protein n=1 Tax=Mytilus coruscus TaxID=42192 RepID=A0A6J8C411_MYTCO|nr:unnamed protein product [Mytilus coruscus]
MSPSCKKVRNHAGARQFSKDIDKYIKKEASYGAILGPFKSNPFRDGLILSPLNSVPKADSEERRVIMDLSFPKGNSVNDCIDKNEYLGNKVDLHYPNMDKLVEIIKKKGPQCHNFKRDLRRAYRQFPLDPKDYNLILKQVLDDCGLEESLEKACPPCSRMSFLGVWFDTEKMTLEVTPVRLTEILALVNAWLLKSKVFRKEVQSLIGKLNFIASCVKPGRIFISRILNFLREFVSDDQCLELSEEFKRDIFWWSEFLLIFNGISILSLEVWTEPDQFFSCDACLSGCGGISSSKYFHCAFPSFITEQNLHINSLELLTVIVCLKVWVRRGKKICIYCDNYVSVQVINHGSSRSKFLQACLREIAFVCAINECEIKAIHLNGKDNRVSDLLSRWDLSPFYQSEFLILSTNSFFRKLK